MTTYKKALFLSLLFVGLMTMARTSVALSEHWERYQQGSVPWNTDHNYALPPKVFKDQIYFKGVPYLLNHDATYRSSDGSSWEPLLTMPTPVGPLVQESGVLYLFSNQDPTARSIWRSQNGADWERIDLNQSGITPEFLVVFKGRLYRVLKNSSGAFSLERASVDVPSPSWELAWEPITLPPVGGITQFFAHGGKLYIAGDTHHLFSSDDGGTWTDLYSWLPTLNAINILPVYRPDGPHLYVEQSSRIWELSDPAGFVWTPLFQPEGNFPSGVVAFDVFGRTHVFGAATNFQVLVQSGIGRWEPIDGSAFGTDEIACHPNSDDGFPLVSTLGNNAFLNLCGLRVLSRGLSALTPMEFLTSTELTGGQKEAPVLAWGVKINVDERQTSLKVTNHGTALAKRDISALKLFRSGRNGTVLVGELSPDADGRVWQTPASFSMALNENDIFIIKADILGTARSGATCRFGVDEMNLQFGSSDTARSLMAASDQIITSNPVGQAPIEGIQIAPVPARDRVFFQYDLDATSDIHIRIFDRMGQMLSEIHETGQTPGRQQTSWDASRTASGVYYATVQIQSSTGAERKLNKKIFIER